MATFGEKFRSAVESHGLDLEQVCRAIGMERSHLEALQRDDYDAIPGDASITDSLDAFARLVDVDPDEVIEDYRRQRKLALSPESTRVEMPVVRDAQETQPLAAPRQATARKPPLGSGAWVTLVMVITLAGLTWVLMSGRQEPAPNDPPARGPAPAASRKAPAEARPAASDTRVEAGQEPSTAAPTTAATAADSQAKQAPPPSGILITQHGVGTGVMNHELVGKGERFTEGTRVWFWNLVEAGTAGTTIRHVWLHAGQEVLVVPLRVGGTRWRTQSYKTLHPGSAGPWVVEARDGDGRLLARRTFECSTPGAD